MDAGRAQRIGQRRSSDELQRVVNAIRHDLPNLRSDLPAVDHDVIHPDATQRVALSGFRVVASNVMPRRLASTAVAIPTEEVPPRISSDSPGLASSPTVNDPYDVCSISGAARASPSRARSETRRPDWRARTCTRHIRRRTPGPSHPSSPRPAASAGNSPPGQSATIPVASIPSTRGNVTPSARPRRVCSSDRFSPNALTSISTHPGFGFRNRQLANGQRLGRSGRIEHHRAHRPRDGLALGHSITATRPHARNSRSRCGSKRHADIR